MARPMKQGLDYFPVDVAIDDKVKMVEAKYGVAGFGIIIKTWQIIYENSYFIKWTERELLLYKNRINADINLINDVINECIKWGVFDQELKDKYDILTSRGLQRRYAEAIKRRKEITIEKAYWIIESPDESLGLRVNYSSYEIDVDNNKDNVDKKYTKKSKVNIKKSKALNEIEDFFEKAWTMYPKKEGKGSISDSQKKKLYDLGEEFIRCIERYVQKRNGEDQKYTQMGSTFFNSGYVDYMDKNYSQQALPIEELTQSERDALKGWGING